ncbi:hypothetical protein EG832_00380 [bacterium]|nr:hypothetical protein [bacterium]
MVLTKDINSTERLLNVIRGSQQSSVEKAESEEVHFSGQRNSKRFSIAFPQITNKYHIKVGIHISRDDVNLAKMARTSDGRMLLIDQKIWKVPDHISKESQEFRDLFKETLNAFAGSPEDCEIWALMSATEINVHYLKIPVVPKKELENVIYWTAAKENPLDEKSMIFDYEMQGEITDQGISKYSVMVYSASRSEIEKMKDMFSAMGINLSGITTAPFAFQNFFRTQWINTAEATFASLYIGNDFSRIDIFSKNNLVMTRGIRTGISSMVEALNESLAEILPKQKIDNERIEKILTEVSADADKSIRDEDGIHWNDGTILNMIRPALERLTRQIDRTLDHYTSSVGYEKVEKVFISSVRNNFYRLILQHVNEQLGIKSESFDPFEAKNFSSSVSLSLMERVSLVPAIGLSLSDRRYTPNAIFTYVEKKKEISKKRINRGILASFAAALLVCVIVLVVQGLEIRQISTEEEKLEKELSLIQPALSREKVMVLAEGLKSRYRNKMQYVKRYEAMAVITEVSLLTPQDIRLTDVRISLPSAMPNQKRDAASKDGTSGVWIEGVVLGDRSTLDTILADYVMKLQNSPIIHTVSIQKSNIVNFKKKEVLQFTVSAKIG